MRKWTLACCALVVAISTVMTFASPIDIGDVLKRSGEYVVEFERQLSGIVAQEHAHQIATRMGRGVDLRSALLMVKPVGGDRYVGFRDVFQANRKPLRDRE